MEMSIAPPKEESIQIKEVWNDNLEEEFALIREIVDQFSYVAMDTEFPGMVLRPVGNFKNINDYNYQTLKDNVDMLKLIQLGLTFSDENGNLPTYGTDKFCIWQFNFREFNVTKDIFTRLFLDDSGELISFVDSIFSICLCMNVAPFAGNNMLVLHSCLANPASKYFVQVLHNEHPIPMAGCNGSDFCPFEEFKAKIVVPHLKHDYNNVCTVQLEEPEHKPATSKLSRLFRWLFAMQNDDTQHTKDEL